MGLRTTSSGIQELSQYLKNGEKVIPCKTARKLSEKIHKILLANEKKDKIPLLADECDGKKSDKAEVTKLNHLFTKNEKFKESVAFLFFQPLKKERMVNDRHIESNKFFQLKMEEKKITYNMWNIIEIKDFVKYTVDVLTEDQTTLCYHLVTNGR